jgi:hypothetical protein
VLFNHGVLPWCVQALALIEYLMDNAESRSFNVSPAAHHFVQNFLWPKCWQKKTGKFKFFKF